MNIKYFLLKVRSQSFQEVRFKVHDPKAHSKGGTLENTINGVRSNNEDENPGPPPHILHPGKVNIFTLHFIAQRITNIKLFKLIFKYIHIWYIQLHTEILT